MQIHAASVQLLGDGQYGSAAFELLSTKHNGAGFLVDYIRGLALVFPQNRKCLGHRRSSLDGLDPTLHVGELFDILAAPFWTARPGEGSDVGDGVLIACQIFVFA